LKSWSSGALEENPMTRPAGEAPVAIARGIRLRGAAGRLTATLVRGGIDQLGERSWVLIGDGKSRPRRYEVEEAESYGRKMVLKLRGVDSAEQASALVGQDIFLPCNGLVDLPAGTYYIFELVGMSVVTRGGEVIGTVRDVYETGGTPLLVIEAPSRVPGVRREEILLPAARSICGNIDTSSGRITIDPPDGLLELYGL
jgi:16S rRNA processing protein RimM